jgi:hypothetical protein
MGNRKSRAEIKVDRAVSAAFANGDSQAAKLAVLGCLRATRRVRSLRDPASGVFSFREAPDSAVRLAAATKVLQWTVGLPTGTVSRT